MTSKRHKTTTKRCKTTTNKSQNDYKIIQNNYKLTHNFTEAQNNYKDIQNNHKETRNDYKETQNSYGCKMTSKRHKTTKKRGKTTTMRCKNNYKATENDYKDTRKLQRWKMTSRRYKIIMRHTTHAKTKQPLRDTEWRERMQNDLRQHLWVIFVAQRVVIHQQHCAVVVCVSVSLGVFLQYIGGAGPLTNLCLNVHCLKSAWLVVYCLFRPTMSNYGGYSCSYSYNSH